MKKPLILSGVIIGLVVTFGLSYSVYSSTTGFSLGGGWLRLDAHSECTYARFSDNIDRFVPSKTYSGWLSFLNNAPNLVQDGCMLGSKAQNDCTSAGGTVRTVGVGAGSYACEFAGSTCPAGWSRHASWGSTSARTCEGRGACWGRGSACTTGAVGFANAGAPTCIYALAYSYYSGGENQCGDLLSTCYANQATVGCI